MRSSPMPITIRTLSRGAKPRPARAGGPRGRDRRACPLPRVGRCILCHRPRPDGRWRCDGRLAVVAMEVVHPGLGVTELLLAETGKACAGFLARAATWFAANGVTIRRVMTDNAFAYRVGLPAKKSGIGGGIPAIAPDGHRRGVVTWPQPEQQFPGPSSAPETGVETDRIAAVSATFRRACPTLPQRYNGPKIRHRNGRNNEEM